MSFHPVASIQGAVQPLSLATSTTTQARALNRALSAAVQTVNDAGYLGSGREVTFSVDQATKVPIVKVIDTASNEVIEQWPPEYLLQFAAEAEKLTRDSG
jgi:uncharacterized FlaG/YvyC family protein